MDKRGPCLQAVIAKDDDHHVLVLFHEVSITLRFRGRRGTPDRIQSETHLRHFDAESHEAFPTYLLSLQETEAAFLRQVATNGSSGLNPLFIRQVHACFCFGHDGYLF